MSRHDWYRNTTWNDAIAETFEAKLARARRKEQYLRIQACILAETEPNVAHSLLDRFFLLPDQHDAAQAHVDRATAYLAQGDVDAALEAYERAIAREAEFPHILTQACFMFPFEVAMRSRREWFAPALAVLQRHKNRVVFPVDQFKWNAAHALIAADEGRSEDARYYALAAMRAASMDHSGFRYHPDIGLVSSSLRQAVKRVRRLCDA